MRAEQSAAAPPMAGKGDNSFFSPSSNDSLSSFEPGQIVFALYYVDGLYYKAKVLDMSGTFSFMVEFCDYGNTQETIGSDILLEQELEERLAGISNPEAVLVVCGKCGEKTPAKDEYCCECSYRLQIKEDPEDRAARILLELTPYGDCKECGGTIMMSDSECLICGLPRDAEKRSQRISAYVEKSERNSRAEKEEKEAADEEKKKEKEVSSEIVSPRKTSLKDRFRTSKKATLSDEETLSIPSSDAVSPRKKSTSVLDRLRGSGSRYKSQDGEEDSNSDSLPPPPAALSPRTKTSLLDRLGLEGFRLARSSNSNSKTKEEPSSDADLPETAPEPIKVEKRKLQNQPQKTAIIFAGNQTKAPPLPPKPASKKTATTASSSPSMVSPPPPPPPKPLIHSCLVCKLKIIPGEPICDFGDSQVYHARCWKCAYCSKALRSFFRVEGAQICAECFEAHQVASRLKCSVCKNPVNEYYRVGNAILCQEDYLKHEQTSKLKCDVCKCALSSYFSHKGKILCQEHYNETALKKCDVCQMPLLKWFSVDGRTICEEDYEKERLKNSVRCSVCRAIVTTSYTKVGNDIFCERDKPKCIDCEKSLDGKFVERDGGKRFCVPCSQSKRNQPTVATKEKMAPSKKPAFVLPKLKLKPKSKSSSPPPAKKFCIECGFQLSLGAKFCGGCAAKVL